MVRSGHFAGVNQTSGHLGCIQTAGESDSNQIPSQIWFSGLSVHTLPHYWPIGVEASSSIACSVWRPIIAVDSGACCDTWMELEWSHYLPTHDEPITSLHVIWRPLVVHQVLEKKLVPIRFAKFGFHVNCDSSDHTKKTSGFNLDWLKIRFQMVDWTRFWPNQLHSIEVQVFQSVLQQCASACASEAKSH